MSCHVINPSNLSNLTSECRESFIHFIEKFFLLGNSISQKNYEKLFSKLVYTIISLPAFPFDSFYFLPIHGYCYESNSIATSAICNICRSCFT